MQRQASMMSFVDVFHVLMVVVLVSIPLLLAMQGPKSAAAAGRAR
jgi:hypothetical protein